MTTNHPRGALIDAIRNRKISAAEALVAGGLDPNFKDPGGYTPLMLASARSQPYLVRVLISAGADVNVIDNRTGNSALHFAAQGGDGEVARALIAAGAFVNLQNPSQGHTPLIDAVIYKKPDVVAVLLDAGANLEIKNNWGYTAGNFIHDLLGQPNTEKSRINTIKSAFDARIARDAQTKSSMHLFKAVLDGDLDGARAAIAAGEDLNAAHPVENTGNDGHTPLLAAARDGRDELTRMLIEAGASMYVADYLYKAFPIFKSCYMGKLGTAVVQVQAGVDLAVQGPWNGYTPLHDALWQGHVDIAQHLVEKGANLELQALSGRTPLDLGRIEYGDGHPIVAAMRERLGSRP